VLVEGTHRRRMGGCRPSHHVLGGALEGRWMTRDGGTTDGSHWRVRTMLRTVGTLDAAATSSRRWCSPQEGHAALTLGAPASTRRRCFEIGVLVIEAAVLSSRCARRPDFGNLVLEVAAASSRQVRRLEAWSIVSRSGQSCLTWRHRSRGCGVVCKAGE
jgi:hypothetical protein